MALDVYKDWLGIPEGPRPPDHYQLLRLVQFEDDIEKVRKNYKKLNAHVRKYASGQYSNQSQVLLNELAKAMLCLTDDEAKQEYDRSLGREIDDRDESGRRPMTAYLQDEGLISSEQAKQATSHADRTGLTIRDAIVQLKMVDAEAAAKAYATEIGRSYIDLSDLLPDNLAMDMVPKKVVRRHNCLPLFIEENAIVVACVDEPDTELEDEIRLRFGKPIRPVIASGKSINQAITTNYADGVRKEVAPVKASGVKSKTSTTSTKTVAAAPQAEKPVVELTDEQKQQRKTMGMLAMAWSFIVPALLDNLILWDMFYKKFLPRIFEWAPYITTFIVGPPLALFFYATMVAEKKS